MERAPSVRTHRPGIVWILVGILGFIAIGGLATGPQLLADPTGAPIGANVSWLEATPLPDWYMVGWFLIAFMGVIPAVIAVGLLTRFSWGFAERVDPSHQEHWAWTATQLMGWGTVLWIGMQLSMIDLHGAVQVVFLVLGVGLAALSRAASVRSYLALDG